VGAILPWAFQAAEKGVAAALRRHMRVAMIEVVAIPQSRDRRYLTNQGFFGSLFRPGLSYSTPPGLGTAKHLCSSS
jgi:hypothetical protein